MSDDVEYRPLMAFFDESVSFCNGFECGQIWQRMDAKEPLAQNVHAANVEQIKAMADVHGYQVDFTLYSPGEDPENTWRWMIGAPGERKH